MFKHYFERRVRHTVPLVLLTLLLPANVLAENIDMSIWRLELAFLAPLIQLAQGNPWLQGGIVIVLTCIVASLLTWILLTVARKATRQKWFTNEDTFIDYLRLPVAYIFLVGGITYGLSLMPLTQSVETVTKNSLHSLGVIIWIFFISKIVSLLLKRVATFSDEFTFIQARTVTLFDSVAKIAILGMGVYFIFLIWNIDVTAWLASAGVAGIAVGFAAKDTLSNLFSGVFIIADAPYKVGDFIVMNSGDRGQVTHIGLRSTRILTRDEIEVTIPNSVIGNATIVNQSGGPSEKMRVRIGFGVAYGTDIDLVRNTIMHIVADDSMVCPSPSPSLRFKSFGTSSLDFELRCWISHPRLSSMVIDRINTKIYNEFNRLNIEIPYTKQDLYIKGLPDNLGIIRHNEEDSASPEQ